MSQRSEATAKAQYEHDLSALEGKWDDNTSLIRSIYVEAAEVGLAAADAVMFSDETVTRIAKTLFAHNVSNGSGETAPEIIDECESAAKEIVKLLKMIANE